MIWCATRRAAASASMTSSTVVGVGPVVALQDGVGDLGDLRPAQPAGEERLDGHLVGRAQPGRRRATGATGVVGQRQAAERASGPGPRSRAEPSVDQSMRPNGVAMRAG